MSAYLPTNGLPIIEEEEATGEVAEIYNEIKSTMQLPFIPNIVKTIAASPEMLAFFWKFWAASVEFRTLPDALISMIDYTISTRSNCTYCSATSELTCRTLGIEEETLHKLIKDLENLNPERVQAIIDFAIKVAHHPQELVRDDYDRVRDQGVTDAEIVEIIITAAAGVLSDIVADALQVDVDNMVSLALDQMR